MLDDNDNDIDVPQKDLTPEENVARYKAMAARWIAKGLGVLALGACVYAWIVTGHEIGDSEMMVIGAILAVIWGEHFIERIWG